MCLSLGLSESAHGALRCVPLTWPNDAIHAHRINATKRLIFSAVFPRPCLQEALSGRAHTTMLATISPSSDNYVETMNTLKYAERLRRASAHLYWNRDVGGAKPIKVWIMITTFVCVMLARGMALSAACTAGLQTHAERSKKHALVGTRAGRSASLPYELLRLHFTALTVSLLCQTTLL